MVIDPTGAYKWMYTNFRISDMLVCMRIQGHHSRMEKPAKRSRWGEDGIDYMKRIRDTLEILVEGMEESLKLAEETDWTTSLTNERFTQFGTQRAGSRWEDSEEIKTAEEAKEDAVNYIKRYIDEAKEVRDLINDFTEGLWPDYKVDQQ